MSKIIFKVAILFFISAHALAAAENQNEQAGVCAVYLESMKIDKKWTDTAWSRATDIRTARHAAERWQMGFTFASGTMKDSYMHEGERACMAINALPGNTK